MQYDVTVECEPDGAMLIILFRCNHCKQWIRASYWGPIAEYDWQQLSRDISKAMTLMLHICYKLIGEPIHERPTKEGNG